MKKLIFLILILLSFTTSVFAGEYWWQDLNGGWHEQNSGKFCWRDLNGNYHCN